VNKHLLRTLLKDRLQTGAPCEGMAPR
jgi:hypothetical protein